ncbi:MAG: hypothetical protein CMH56_03580 [Myxococcales bacterium]|nr:hypothetical protein [Myxococcales bacterium]|tara:strand:+ start:359 stop:583 length:225 start_codon:yes stop_codon:yes gene_type:complete
MKSMILCLPFLLALSQACGDLEPAPACAAQDMVCEEDQVACEEDEIGEDFCLEYTSGENECEMVIYCKSTLIED